MRTVHPILVLIFLWSNVIAAAQSPADSSSRPPYISFEEQSVTFSKFPNEGGLTSEKLFKTDVAVNKLYLQDSCLILKPDNASDYIFYQYSLSRKTLTAKIFKIGQGNKEIRSAFASGLYHNCLWAYDITMNKIIISKDLKTSINKGILQVQSYIIPHFYYNIQFIDSLKFLGNGAQHSIYKIQEAELPSGAEAAEFGSFGAPPKDIPFYSWKGAYESFLFAKPDGRSAVTACRFTDQIEVFNLSNKKATLIKGPEGFPVEFDPIKVGNIDMMADNEKTRYAFVNGAVTDKYIYLLYSGHSTTNSHHNAGKYIYVYDWNGTPVKKIVLDHYILGFTVSENDKALYSFNSESNFIEKSQLIL